MKPTNQRTETSTAIIFRSWPALGLSVILWLACVLGAGAGTKTWDGSATGNWGDAANWVGGVAPVDGDSLVFPFTASNKATTNNILDLSLASIRFDGSNYSVRGAAVGLSSIQAGNHAGVNNVHVGLTIGSTVVNNVWVPQPNATLYLRGAIHLNGYGLYIGGSGTTHVSGAVDGTGIVVQNGPGTAYLDGSSPNSYSGETTVSDGTLTLNKTAGVISVPGTLSIGNESGPDTVRLLTDDQIATNAAVYVRNDGVLDLNGQSNTVASLTFLEGGTVTTGTGCLKLGGDVTTTSTNEATATINGRLHLGDETRTFTMNGPEDESGLVINADLSGGSRMIGPSVRFAGLIKAGTGRMVLAGDNTYRGHTTVNQGELNVTSDTGLGSTWSGTTVNNDALLWLNGAEVGTEDLTLNCTNDFGGLRATGTCGCDGDIILETNATILGYGGTLTLNGQIRGTGDLTLGDPWYPGATFVMGGSTSNLYIGVTWLRSGTLVLAKSVMWGTVPGDLIIGDDLGIADADVVRLQGNAQLDFASDVTITSSGLLDLNGYGTYTDGLTGTGRLSLQDGVLSVGPDDGSSVFDGTITGADGLLRKIGNGTLTLTGTNTYAGTNLVDGGRFIVNGYQPNSAVMVDDNLSHPLLGGTGTVGDIYMLGGRLAPGTSAGVLTCGNLVMSPASTLEIELNGFFPGQGAAYDQLKVRGTVNLGGASLQATLGITPWEGQQFIIIDNDGTDAVAGTFAGYPEGALVPVDPLQCSISYGTSPSPNDVRLTFTNTALPCVDTEFRAGNGNSVLDTNECAYLWVTLSNATAVPMQGLTARLRSLTPDLTVTYGSSAYPSVAPGVAVANTEPFQIATLPGFLCGRTARFGVDVESTSHGGFFFYLTVPTGSTGLGIPYTWSGSLDIPDRTSVTSSIPVGGFSQPVAKVRVSLHLTHRNVDDLILTLIAPNGQAIQLSSRNGGSGDDYGTSCDTLHDQTTFDDDASRSIASGAAPFVGQFRPEGSLSALRGISGDGTWNLVVSDRVANLIGGMLRCWTLTLYPFACADGGGICDICPNREISGMMGGSSPQQNGYGPLGFPSDCGAETAFTFVNPGPVNYHAYSFVQTETNACIKATLASEANLFCVVYTNGYDPANPLAHNYANSAALTDDDTPPVDFFFMARAGVTYTLVITSTNLMSTNAQTDYTLTLSGGNCRPVLNITPADADRVVLDWTTAAAGYWLESANQLTSPPSPAWDLVPDLATVVHSRFTVTNTIAGETNRFYRLHKP